MLPVDSLHTLDPFRILDQLVKAIPGVTVCVGDQAQALVEGLRDAGAVDGAIRVAQADARRRGPMWAFRIQSGDEAIPGGVERRRLSIHRDDQDIPAELKSRFLAFLEDLEIPDAKVESYSLDGNTREAT